jgi:hypothetical protein
MLTAVVFAFNGCSEEDYESRYSDPNKVSEAQLDQLMSGTMLYSNNFFMSGYSRYFGYEPQNLSKQANTLGFTLDDGIYYKYELSGWGEPPYGDLMSAIASFRVMQSLYNELSDAEKAENELFLLAAQIHLLAHTLYILDFYGDIPFDDVGKIALSRDVADSNPHYQKAVDLYKMALDDLGTIEAKLSTVNKPATFTVQDFLNKGDIDAWRRYANSIRLRAALTVSTQGALASQGQDIIKEILGNPSKYPIVENNDQNIQCAQQSSGPLNVEGGSGFDWHNLQTASSELIKRMQKAGDGGVWVEGQDDPRLPIHYCLATKNGEQPVATKAEEKVGNPLKTGLAVPTVFRGACASSDYNEYQEMFFTRTNRGYYSRVRNCGFFWRNQSWDHQVITAAEVWFIRAEAMQRGWISGDAKSAFKEAVKQSIRFYFKYHNNRSRKESDNADADYLNGIQQRVVINPTEPDDAWISSFADDRWTKRIDNTPLEPLAAIIDQKWVHLSYLFSGQAWTDLRRTGLPRMVYAPDHSANAEVRNPANRLRYPDSDRDKNINFQAEVGAIDNYTTVMFWAIEHWHD